MRAAVLTHSRVLVAQDKVLARIATVFCAPHCASPTFRRHLVRCIAASMDVRAAATLPPPVSCCSRTVHRAYSRWFSLIVRRRRRRSWWSWTKLAAWTAWWRCSGRSCQRANGITRHSLWATLSSASSHARGTVRAYRVGCVCLRRSVIACAEPCLAKLAAVDVIPPLVEVVKGGDASKAATESVARSLKVARKNAAIALARMAAHPRVRKAPRFRPSPRPNVSSHVRLHQQAKQRMDELQAMKILIQLQGEIA